MKTGSSVWFELLCGFTYTYICLLDYSGLLLWFISSLLWILRLYIEDGRRRSNAEIYTGYECCHLVHLEPDSAMLRFPANCRHSCLCRQSPLKAPFVAQKCISCPYAPVIKQTFVFLFLGPDQSRLSLSLQSWLHPVFIPQMTDLNQYFLRNLYLIRSKK